MNQTLSRILYAEDEQDIQTIARIALENIGGFTLKICSSGRELLTCAQEFGPDMILLDVMMPELDGPGTLKELRQIPALKDIPVAFMTAKVQSHEVEQLMSLGAIGVISKPFDPMTLSGQIMEKWSQYGSASGENQS